MRIANGAVHGSGVYAANGPDTPMLYSKQSGISQVIIARALVGRKGGRHEKDGFDCWLPRDDWVVFRDSAQLYPEYVVSYD